MNPKRIMAIIALVCAVLSPVVGSVPLLLIAVILLAVLQLI